MKISYTDDIKNIANWIKEKVADKRIILGISGGIDSAVVLGLCVKAVGADRVTAIVLPCESNPQDRIDAFKVMEQYPGIDIIHYSLDNALHGMVDEYNDLINNNWQDEDNNLTGLTVLSHGNMKSRLRMVSLYMFANQLNGVVMGTTNKTEMMIGYFTKYGDGGVDFEPIADYFKTEIWEIAKYLGVPEKIINKAPNAGLGISNTDEEELGLSYDAIDNYLQGKVDGSTREYNVVKRVIQSNHKRNLPPSYKREDKQ